ncbi:hypothetical protein [Pandoravirus japonicus]|uniref:Uncharacterized protein n=1 Tax=Pandoravirus japonicus TaxID=2823154 RepID=A0A811BNR2_9VIRU|nr:hypothetical protein [Pandoravirus japonicus]
MRRPPRRPALSLSFRVWPAFRRAHRSRARTVLSPCPSNCPATSPDFGVDDGSRATINGSGKASKREDTF